MEDRKKHAYFQDNYRRSSNFGKMDTDKKTKTNEDGTIELEEEQTKDVKELRKTVDNVIKDSEKPE